MTSAAARRSRRLSALVSSHQAAGSRSLVPKFPQSFDTRFTFLIDFVVGEAFLAIDRLSVIHLLDLKVAHSLSMDDLNRHNTRLESQDEHYH